MTWSSTVPASMAALVSIFTATLPGVDVLDGPAVSGSPRLEAVTVGFDDPTSGVPAVAAQAAPEGATVARSREVYSVQCGVIVRRGSNDIAAARQRAAELFALAGHALVANRTLNGAVMSAHIGGHSWSQTVDERGALVVVAFGVAVDAYAKEST